VSGDPGKDRIPCSRCNGTGCVDLPPELTETLNALREHGALTSSELCTVLSNHPTIQAIINRLTDLRRLGLVARHWVSKRKFIYEAVDAPGRKP